MSAREVFVDVLLDRLVRDAEGRRVGHLQEIRVVRDGATWRVDEYHVGAFALFERLGGWPLGRAVLGALGLSRKGGGYRVPWSELDLTDPDRPRLRCPVQALQRLEEEPYADPG